MWNTKGDANEKRISFSDGEIYSVFYIGRCSAGGIISGSIIMPLLSSLVFMFFVPEKNNNQGEI